MGIERRTLLASIAAGLSTLAGCGRPTADDRPRLETEPNYRGWFDGVSNYDGTLDLRGRNAVAVDVGVAGNLGYYKFGPAAVAVSPGTTVSWEWTGDGGAHNVVAREGAFDSGDPVRSAETTFQATLDEPAIYRYYCEPHRGQGMRGAVFVALE